jgi:Protein of unknown function (DUF4435)
MSGAFHRTSSGLSNQALFFGVDVVLYFEGGETQYTITDLERDSKPSEDLDTMFWQTVFKVSRPRLRVHFKSVGSKQSILPICQLILGGSVNRVVAALDRDWDHKNGKRLRHPNILYTRGYSWENDVFTKGNLFILCGRFALSASKVPAAKAKIGELFLEFEKAFEKLVKWEHALARAGAPPCDRTTIEKAIQIRTPAAPTISRASIARLLWNTRQVHRQVKLKCGVRGVSVDKDFYGHGIEKFSLALFQHICATILNARLTNDVCTRLLIGIFERTLRNGGAANKHYRSAVLSIRR